MSCFIYQSMEKVLRPCGVKCNDIRNFLIERSGSTEEELLGSILNELQFGQGQRKAVLWVEEDIRTDESIHLFILLQGTGNLEFIELLSRSLNYSESTYSSRFGRIQMFTQAYNKCYCDYCIGQNFHWISNRTRVIVFDDFFVSISETVSLVQCSIKAMIRKFECCNVSLDRDHILWLSDGDDPVSSICRLSTRVDSSHKLISWEDLGYESFLLTDIKEEELHLFSIKGFKTLVRHYPKKIEDYFDYSTDLFFITKTTADFTLMCFDQNYDNVVNKGTLTSLWSGRGEEI